MTPLQQAAPVRAVVLSAVPVSASMAAYLEPGAFIVACDAGYRNAETLGVVPDLIVGDFDSAPQPPVRHEHTIVLPHVKDDTDTHFAARWLWQHGCREVTFLGALGGQRFEHTVANLHTALFLAKNGVQVLLADERSELRILCPGQPMTLERKGWTYLSLFPLDGPLTGVEEQGVFYPLQDAVLTPDYPLGVSNEFTAPQAVLSCRAGHGLVVLSRADTL
ncbi:MAG TPA: thiamine diphosphokinase [Candidatus Gemmiger stercoripullorum]|nr:thiamine diphosphokinase [Candidatus Gemmiger stercoripullorum]